MTSGAVSVADVCEGRFPSRILQSDNTLGAAWEVEITRSGVSDSKRLEWPPEVLQRDAALFNNVPSYADHQSDEEWKRGQGRRVQDLVGYIEEPHMGHEALVGTLHLLEPEKWAPKLRAIQQAPAGIGGMSLDVLFRAAPKAGLILGRVTQVMKVLSVDLVSRPDAGGRILRAVASRPGEFEEFYPSCTPTESGPVTFDAAFERLYTLAGWKLAADGETVSSHMSRVTQSEEWRKNPITLVDELFRVVGYHRVGL